MISIITACYNDNEIVKRCIYSALQQNIPNGELILVDDGSAIPLENLWGNKVKLIRHPQNRGLSAALNTGIKAATNEYYVILSADDMFRSDWAKVMLPHLGKADIISCDFQGDSGRPVECKPGSLKDLINSNCHSYSAITRKKVWEATGGFKEYMNPSWEDWEHWLHAAKLGFTWFHVPQAVHLYYRNPKGRDATSQGKDILLRGKLEGAHQDLYGKGKGLVTFIIPCYKQEGFVLEALQSVYEQKYPHVRAVIVDDGSPGDILEVLKQAPPIKDLAVIRQKNKGLSAARNTGARYATEIFNSQYLCMLDADDKIHPNFVEECLSVFEQKMYVYTDIEFFGSGSGNLLVPEFSCQQLSRKHLHACTFIMESSLWKNVMLRRGYGYDEKMREGYEDWEFVVAAVEAGFCGKRLAKPYFYYRQHPNGSMRTEAIKINNKLAAYISSKHPWMKGDVTMPCSTCGGRRTMGRIVVNKNGAQSKVLVSVPGVGEVDPASVILVTFHGSRLDTQTKVGKGLPGRGSATYRFNGKECNPTNPNAPCRKFPIFAIDVDLFATSEFTFSKREAAPVVHTTVEAAPLNKTEIVFEKTTVVAEEPDDLTQLAYIGPVTAKKLNEAGIFHFHQVTAERVKEVLGFPKAKAQEVANEAQEKVHVAA